MHEKYIRRCLELAEKGKGNVAPNPMVGAVLVHEDTILAEGWHQQFGEAHAEVNCIENVPADKKYLVPESTLYVSLEPCAHYGKTPPCAERIVQEKIPKVVICNDDPFEKVAGKGFQIMEENGVRVERSVLQAEGKWLNRRFFHFHSRKRPYIILKWAQTNNGYFAPADRSCFQITNKHSSQLVHKWRTEEAAIMVGFTTALNDDPQLTARLYRGKQPLRIVLDRNLSLPLSHKLFSDAVPTLVFNEKKDEIQSSITYKNIPFNENLIENIVTALFEMNITSMIVEGGARLLSSFIGKSLWDEARIFTGEKQLTSGISAPRLPFSKLIFETDSAGDTLQVYTHLDNPFVYKPNMSL